MKKKRYLLFSSALFIASLIVSARGVNISSPTQEKGKRKHEAISLLGQKLFATPFSGMEMVEREKKLAKVRKKYEADPNSIENIIEYGRELASLWRYRMAMSIYSKGIEKFPDNAMLYRHRGHRYISVREFDNALIDLTKASELNDHNFDIWYHLGLAYYLKGELKKAFEAYKECQKVAEDDDSKIAISNWLYITLRRLGKKGDASTVLEAITEGMKVVENQAYYNLLLFYKGIKPEEEIAKSFETSELDLATSGYGIGSWYLYNGNEEKAREYFNKIVNTSYWPAFGFIAAEADLSRIKKQD